MDNESSKPTLLVLATGGTIAGRQTDRSRPGYRAGEHTVGSLLEAVPELHQIAQLEARTIAAVGSQNITFPVWLKLLNTLNAALADPKIAGAIVTHGTDTMEETAYFLNLTVKSEKPVVLSGAMRPATALSADGPMNLFNAAVVASAPQSTGRGVMVVMNDEVHYAAEVTKTDTTNPDSMRSPNRGRAAVCDNGVVSFFSHTDKRHTVHSEFDVGETIEALPDVAIIYAHADLTDGPVRGALSTGARGIVVAGLGDGNMSDAALEALTRAARAGVVVVRSSHVGSGVVRRNVEVDDNARGFVAAGELNPKKARVLLGLALTITDDVSEIQRMFDEY